MTQPALKKLIVEYLPIKVVKPYERNPRKNDAAVDAVMRSIQEFGFKQPIVVDASMVIVVGHTRYKAALKMGLDTVPVAVADDLTPEQCKAYRIADNKTASLSDWDDVLLVEELKEIMANGTDVAAVGFSEKELEDVLGMLPRQGKDEDDVPEEPEVAVAKPGDLWILGEHRLFCGDSLAPETISRLLSGKKAHLVFTDPPYNVDYGSSKNPRHKIRTIANDAMGKAAWIQFCERLAETIKATCDGDVYVWGAPGPEGMRQRLILHDTGIHWSATIIWKKQQLVLSPAKYQRLYEPCFYGWPGKSGFEGDRKKTEVWEFDRPQKSDLHPTQKPIALCEYGILNSSRRGDIVLDLFLGSGSTLIACEKTARKCYGVELEPKYCDVIVKRWEDFTGKKAYRAEDANSNQATRP